MSHGVTGKGLFREKFHGEVSSVKEVKQVRYHVH